MENKMEVSRESMIDIATKVKEVKEKIAAAKVLYEELDNLVNIIRSIGCEKIEDFDGNGTDVVLVDNFAEKNTVFRPCGIKRYEVEIVTAEDKIKEAEKAAKKAKKAK